MTNKVLLYTGIGLLLLSALKKTKQYYDELQVRFSGFVINKLLLFGNTSLSFGIDIYNPTPVNLTVNSLIGDVYVNNHYVGTIKNYNQQIIAAYSASTVQASLTVPTVSLAADLVRILQDKPTNYEIRYKGFIVVQNMNLKLNFKTIL
ncbi:MAG: LEA type 2 family protein [Paludibacteraceae bacterium]|nr:LEA type 2 family protein [Paludibacteraceae bacterium]